MRSIVGAPTIAPRAPSKTIFPPVAALTRASPQERTVSLRAAKKSPAAASATSTSRASSTRFIRSAPRDAGTQPLRGSRPRGSKSPNAMRWSSPSASKRVPEREVNAHAVRLFPVGHVVAQRADRRAYTCADTGADCRLQVGERVGGVACVDERGESPALGEPVRVLDARHREIPATHDGVPVLHAEALEGIATHR